MEDIKYYTYQPGTANHHEFLTFLKETDEVTIPRLSSRVNLEEYAKKVSQKAIMFVAKVGETWIGVEAVYFNKYPDFSYNTILRVRKEYHNNSDIGMNIMLMQRKYLKEHGTKGLRFDIRKSNTALLNYHLKTGGRIISEHTYPGTDIIEVHMEKIFIKD